MYYILGTCIIKNDRMEPKYSSNNDRLFFGIDYSCFMIITMSC